ncbi:hypothetical protein BJX99DRAFT_255359 [Aspergillus californicus]
MQTPSAVRIVEVGPRDGLQNIPDAVPSATKLQLIQRLANTGLRAIELTSVVSPRRIPQLADCQQVLQSATVRQLQEDPRLRLPVLVPNIKGLQIALQHGTKAVAVFVSATEGFSKANINCTIEQGLERARSVTAEAIRSDVAVRGYISCIFQDPYDGPTPPANVLRCARSLLDAGCYEVSLGDTLGVGTPADVRALIAYLVKHDIPLATLAGHFHDTYGQATANAWEAYNCGIRVFDSSVAGLGGCPFAPGAKGNVATEDLVYMFHGAGVETGVDLPKLVETGVWISKRLNRSNSSRVGIALSTKGARSSTRARSPLTWKLSLDDEGLQVYQSGMNLKIVLNRPRNGNALTTTMIANLTKLIKDASTNQSISRIIITATGKFFCTGMDLGKGSTPVGRSSTESDNQFHRLTNLFEAIDTSPKVTIACLNGPAFGGGVGLAFACDIRLCVRTATVTLSEGKLGLCPATISKYVIREWGVPFARNAMISARPVKPDELKSLGIVSEVAGSVQELDQVLDALLVQLRDVSRDASRMSKELVRLAWAHAGDGMQARGIKGLFEEMMRPGGDAAHGVKEFQAGRRIDWDVYSGAQGGAKPKL